jgi:hypothetical protein
VLDVELHACGGDGESPGSRVRRKQDGPADRQVRIGSARSGPSRRG